MDPADVAHGVAQLVERDARGAQHAGSGRVGDEPATAPLEQRCTEPLLQPEQPLAQRRLADVEVVGCRGERLVLIERFEQLEVTDVDIHNVSLP